MNLCGSESEGVEFQLSAVSFSDIFLCVFRSHRSFRFGACQKGRERLAQGFDRKYLAQQGRFSVKPSGLTLKAATPGYTFAPGTDDHQMQTDTDGGGKEYDGKGEKDKVCNRLNNKNIRNRELI